MITAPSHLLYSAWKSCAWSHSSRKKLLAATCSGGDGARSGIFLLSVRVSVCNWSPRTASFYWTHQALEVAHLGWKSCSIDVTRARYGQTEVFCVKGHPGPATRKDVSFHLVYHNVGTRTTCRSETKSLASPFLLDREDPKSGGKWVPFSFRTLSAAFSGFQGRLEIDHPAETVGPQGRVASKI